MIMALARGLLILGTTAFTGLAVRYVATEVIEVPQVNDEAQQPRERSRIERRLNPDSLGAVIANRNPFRRDRRPSSILFDPTRAEGAPPPPSAPVRPTLVVTGVVLGGNPAALVEGLPGVEGTRLMNLGERIGAFQLREVTRTRAVISGRDTTWTIPVKGRTQ